MTAPNGRIRDQYDQLDERYKVLRVAQGRAIAPAVAHRWATTWKSSTRSARARRADRRFELMMSGELFPKLDATEVDEIQRDLVLLVDASLARGQKELSGSKVEGFRDPATDRYSTRTNG